MDNKAKLAKNLIIVGILWCAVGIILIIASNVFIYFGNNQLLLLVPKHLKNGVLTGFLVFPGLGLYLVGRHILKKVMADAEP
jgi:hypothetical protein